MKLVLLLLVALTARSIDASGFGRWRVRYGDTARLGQYPDLVLLYSGSSICTGSIVGSTKVLTAGHCVCGQSPMRDVITETITTDKGLDPRKIYKVAKWAAHSDYGQECSNLQRGVQGGGVGGQDIAMITVDKPFKYSDTVAVRQLASNKPSAGDRMTIVGYGKDEVGKTGTLKFGSVTLQDCPPGVSFGERAICYNADEKVNRQATGSGDSGGPMLNSKNNIVGVTSGKISWSNGLKIGVHASVDGNRAWVLKQ